MIGHLAAAVSLDLKHRKFPVPVSYGPERAVRDGFNSAVVFARDRKIGDQLVAPVGANGLNPEVPLNRVVAGYFVAYARSPKPGATVLDHEDECDRICDGVLTAMVRLLKSKRLLFTISASHLLDRYELTAELSSGLKATEQQSIADRSGVHSADFPGCAARVNFTVRTAVPDITYPGAGRATGEITAVAIPVITSDGYLDLDEGNLPIPP